MPYIGQSPSTGQFIELDALTASATDTYTLQLNSANFAPESVNNLIVSINGVVQKPSSMSLNGSSLTVGATLSSSDTIDYVRVLGHVGSVVTPTDGSVTTAKIGTGAVTSAKLDTNINTAYDFIASAQQFRLASSQVGSASAGTYLTNFEESDTDYQALGSAWSHSSGEFSCSVAGIYMCSWAMVTKDTGQGDRYDPSIQISTDSGSNYNVRSLAWGHTDVDNDGAIDGTLSQTFIFDVADTSTFRLKFAQSTTNDVASTTTILGNSGYNATHIMFIRLGAT